MPTSLRTVVVVLVAIAAVGASGAVIFAATPADDTPTPMTATDTPTDTAAKTPTHAAPMGTPDAVEPTDSGSGPRAGFWRPTANTTLFDAKSHDGVLLEENGSYYLIAGRNGTQDLYRTDELPADRDDWQLVDDDYFAHVYEIDSVIRAEDRWIMYANGNVYSAQTLEADRWVHRGSTGFRDLGAYYDEETGLVHVYYEHGEAAELSGKRIGHAVSPNGVGDWERTDPVWTAPDGLGVGDFAIVERDDTVYILGDYDPYHPKYNVSVWVNDDFDGEFRKLDEPAITPRRDQPQYRDSFGIQDPTIHPINDTHYYLVANGHSNHSRVTLHYYVGEIGNRSTNQT